MSRFISQEGLREMSIVHLTEYLRVNVTKGSQDFPDAWVKTCRLFMTHWSDESRAYMRQIHESQLKGDVRAEHMFGFRFLGSSSALNIKECRKTADHCRVQAGVMSTDYRWTAEVIQLGALMCLYGRATYRGSGSIPRDATNVRSSVTVSVKYLLLNSGRSR